MPSHEKTLSPDDYLQWERAAEFKSEYHRGTVTLVAGASHNHNPQRASFTFHSKENHANILVMTFVFGSLPKNFTPTPI